MVHRSSLVDLLIFMGQSNMAGRGDAALAPAVLPGMGFEYRAVTAPDRLFPLQEPFGVNENDPAGVNEPGMKTGSMVSSFVNACTAQTGVPIVAVSCAKGGSAIAEWMPGTPYYQDALRRVRQCRRWLGDNCFTVRHSAMVWCQGCTDGDLHTRKTVYKLDTDRMLHEFMFDAKLETCFLIQIGNQRDDPELYRPIQQAQEELATAYDDVVLVSRLFKTFAAKGLMKDKFHYRQPAYNLVGAEAGQNAADFWQNKQLLEDFHLVS